MTSGRGPGRLAVELIVAGLLILLLAAGLTTLNCDPADSRRLTEESFNTLVCPGNPPGARGPAPAYFFLFSRLFWLWILGGGTFAVGLGLGVRDWLRRGNPAPVVHQEQRPPEKPDARAPVDSPRPSASALLGRTEQRSSEPMAALRYDLRHAVDAGDLDGAIELGEQAVADSGDAVLIEAARGAVADLDWTEIVAAAIEADVELKEIGHPGCGEVVLALGSLDENRLTIGENYHAPEPSQVRDPGRPRGRRAPSRDRSYRALRLDGLKPLAAIERKPVISADRDEWDRNIRAAALAGVLLVLRYLDAVRQAAASTGLPFPVLLHAHVESVGGEDAIRQRDTFLGLDLPCQVAPIGPEVAERLAQRYERQLAQWRKNAEITLTNFRKEFERTGYVHSRFIPLSMPEYERFRGLEQQLAIYEPENRVSMREFDVIAARMAVVMERELPPPIDPAPYLG